MVQLAIPSFTGLPDAAVKEVDAYTEQSAELKNQLASKVTAFGVGADELIQKSLGVVKGIGNKILNNGIDLNMARTRIADALKGSRSSIVSLATDVERSIMEELTGEDTGTGYVRKATDMIDGVKMVLNQKDYYFKDGNFSGVNSIIGFMGDLTNNSLLRVFDLGAEAALMKGIIEEVTAWGIPDLVDETFGAKWTDNKYEYDYDDDFRFSVVKRASASISPSTDLATIERLMLHGGVSALIAENPNFPAQLLQNYVFPEECVPGGPFPKMIPDPNNPTGPEIPDPTGAQERPNYADQMATLVRILNQLKPDWFTTRRQGQPVWNLYFLSHASEDATTLILSSETHREAMLTAPFYKMENPIELIKSFYPDAAIQ
ncbi:hypothetical protein [Pseudomonas phage PA1C]|uniref:Uncharacterized protein n=1 Tax=Pseudomonas phage vB_PaeM_PS119XW TaxID=2601632 RepID=A0A5C1K7R6_9CAUD|nr:hypothetical protein PP933_gp206 [Pseudomonas phage vB_PaeM_PS119XW]QBX32361.1 hypothetical protein [Pseudomonas phage PA1C]QEM41935.1 hypothetical protein [Pseudomonas phage vB_PaeM_PS119XW]